MQNKISFERKILFLQNKSSLSEIYNREQFIIIYY